MVPLKITQRISGVYNSSLVPRPFKRRRREGLVHIARACAGVSIATDRVTFLLLLLKGLGTRLYVLQQVRVVDE